MNNVRSLFILAVVLLLAEESLQTRTKFRRAVSQTNRKYQCGVRKQLVEGLITSGSNTKLGEWPWHGAIFYRKNRKSREYKCGATLIHQNFVITAGHCVVDRDSGYEVNPSSVTVDFGYVQLFGASSYGQSHTVAEIFVHPQFSKDSNKHDVAILSLKTVVRFSDYVLPICVGLSKTKNDIHDIIGVRGVVVGWGMTEADIQSSFLKMAKLPVVDYAECQESDPDLFGQLIYSGMFCAGSRNGTSVCNGDSGGGMYFKHERKWTLRGIISFSKPRSEGSNKCDVNNYAGFMNVQYYASWIAEIINEESSGVPSDTSNEVATESNAQLLPWREPPRETTNTSTYLPSAYPGADNTCPRGQLCLEIRRCAEIHSWYNTRNENFQSCGTEEHNNRAIVRICCETSESDVPKQCGRGKPSRFSTSHPRYATLEEYPWMVKLSGRSNEFECQGVLVAQRYVIVSAYCSLNSVLVYAQFGGTNSDHRQCSREIGCYTIRVKRIIYHPMFSENKNVSSEDKSNYNIALVELDSPVEINRSVNPICLPRSTSEPNLLNVVFTSWRFADYFVNVNERVYGISNYAPMQHFTTSADEDLTPSQEDAIFYGAALQLISNSGQMVLIGMETQRQYRADKNHDYAILAPSVIDWIRQVTEVN